MTKDVTAGPFGAPNRWRPLKWELEGKKYLWIKEFVSIFPIGIREDGVIDDNGWTHEAL